MRVRQISVSHDVPAAFADALFLDIGSLLKVRIPRGVVVSVITASRALVAGFAVGALVGGAFGAKSLRVVVVGAVCAA